MEILYRAGRKLVGDRTAKSRLNSVSVTESQFADDAALYTTSRQSMEIISNKFVACASRWGLTVSTRKTKGLSVSSEIDRADMVLEGGGGVLEVVPQSV